MPRRQPAPPDPKLGPVLEFMQALWALTHALEERSRQMERELQLTGPQRLVVRMVGHFPGIGAKRLSELLHLHPSTLSGILRRLVARGFVTREASASDGRRVVLQLTPAGRVRADKIGGTVEAEVERMLARTPPEQIASTREVLNRLTALLQQDDAPSRS